jgi:diguanylate cyclase (GGDEF)-like protein/PAS domain S-box-containing protein
MDFFMLLDSESIESLARECEEMVLDPYEILFKEGEQGDAMYVILSGDLAVEREDAIIAKRVKGDHVGEMALIESGPRVATVKALSKTNLLKLSKRQFYSYFASNRQALMEILKTISERSREDLAALERSMKKLQAEKKVTSRLQDLLNNTSNEIYTLDPITYCFEQMNSRALKNLEYQSAEITQLKVTDIVVEVDLTQFEEWVDLLRSNKKDEIDFNAIHRRKDGSFYPVKTQLKLTYSESSPVVVGISQDVSELREIEDKYNQLTFYDPLTGLPNRTLIIDELSSAVLTANKEDKVVSVLLIDLQNFKTISNSLGHMMGDLLSLAVARRLETEFPQPSIVGRGRDNEFIAILSDPETESNAEEAACLIIDSFKSPFSISGQDIFVNLAIGISSFPAHGQSAETLIEQAETAAKHIAIEGENAYCHYKADMPFILKNKLLLEGDLRKGLERGEFGLHYQPKLALESETITGFEALVRWNHPERGVISPLDFIPIAEQSSIIISIGEWVLETACRQMDSWLKKGLPIKNIAVNLSGRQFKQDELVENIKKIISDSGIHPEYLELEITETILMANLDTVTIKLKQLSEMGVKLSLDDFGTGYSSLRYLNSFPLNNVKIDQTFVKDISTKENATIAKAIVSLAQSFGLKTIAEGVESESQKDIMREIGCDFIQGYLLGRPIPPEEVPQLLSSQ